MKKNNVKMFEPGEKVVVVGASVTDRDVLTFKDPVSFVTEIASTDAEATGQLTNDQFMLRVSQIMGAADNISIPHHNEEAFIRALIKFGVCSSATLN